MTLQEEAERGRRAAQFREEFLEPILSDRRCWLNEQLMTCPAQDRDRLQALVVQLQTIEQIERDIQAYIDTGTLASMQMA